MSLALHILAGFAWLILALVSGWVLLILLDVFVFPRWWPSKAFAPICGALGHTDEDTDEDEAGFGVCARCGVVIWDAGD